jgi:biotin operon repressor
MTDEERRIQELEEEVYRLEEIIVNLQEENEKLKNKTGRKEQVLELLKENKKISILEIANQLNISTKNVSSQLTYLRSDGYKINTDYNGRKFLETDED